MAPLSGLGDNDMPLAVFRETVKKFADSTAIVDDAEELTYGELAGRVELLAMALPERFRIGRGDIVAVSLPNCWQFAALFLSLAGLGAVFVPVNPNWRKGELAWCAAAIRPLLVVAGEDQAACWKEAGYPAERIIPPELVADLSTGTRFSRMPLPSSPASEDHVLYLLTSGSTGFPKVAPRSNRNLVAGARNVGAALGGIAGKRFLGVVPFHHANGFANSLLLPLLTGGCVIAVRRYLPGPLFDMLKKLRPQVLVGSPFIYRTLMDSAGAGRNPEALECCLSSGAQIPCDLVIAWEERFGSRIRQLYGSSETGTISIEGANAPAENITAGQPVPNVEVRIEPAREGEEGGEILVRSPAAMSGYLLESGVVETSVDGFLHTGDMGGFDGEGNIVIRGRRKRIVNLKGLKVDPVEIENLIRGISGVAECLVTSVVGEGGGEVLKAAVAVEEGSSVTRGELIERCRRLAEYKIPRIVEITEKREDGILGKRSLY